MEEDDMAVQGINPYNPGNPVKPVHFAGRMVEIAEIRGKLAAARKGYPVSIFVKGEWGIGKTSLLWKLHPEFSEHGVVAREDVPEGSASAQVRAFYPAIFQDLAAEADFEIIPDFIDYDQPRSLRKLLVQLISTLWRKKDLITVVVLDNLERAEPEFLAGIKDVFQRVGEEAPHFMLVFAGKSLPGTGGHASDPIARFFQTIPIGPMNDEEALEAIFKPIELDRDFSIDKKAAELIQSRAAGHPYFLKQICFQVYASAGGAGVIDLDWLENHWDEVEDNLERIRFSAEFDGLPGAESHTLIHGSLHGVEFPRSAISGLKVSALDTALRRLMKERGLLESAARGVYRFYHPLFHKFVLAKARALDIVTPSLPWSSLEELIQQGEGGRLEFKETLEYDTKTGAKSPQLIDSVLKTVAAFHNTDGGLLLIGVANDGTVMGLERDMKLLSKGKRTRDGFALKIRSLVRDRLKPKRPNRVKIHFDSSLGEEICIVEVFRLSDVTYLGETLYVRDGEASTKINPGEDTERYLRERGSD